jgi:ABC-2 type transport system ATP-binding protein
VTAVPHRDRPQSLLEVSHLTKTYDGHAALDDLDLRVEAGHLVALVGHNGAGKSTLLGCVAGLIEPTAGVVRINGHEAGSLPARAGLSYAGDNPVLYDDLSVWEHLEYVAALHGVDDWQTPGRALVKMFELLDRADDLPSRFSRGMRQKVALAVALVRGAPLVVIDEPFVGLDMKAQAALTETLVARARSGSTVIVATHQPLFLSHADACVLLADGRLDYYGPPNDEVLDTLQKGE